MQVFSYRTKIEDVKGWNCCALSNNSQTNISIKRLDINCSTFVDIALLLTEIESIRYKVDVSEYINSFDEVPMVEGVNAYHNPELFDPISTLKYALIDARDNYRMIDALDKLILKPGQAIAIRAIPGDPYKDITITINFEATKNAV